MNTICNTCKRPLIDGSCPEVAFGRNKLGQALLARDDKMQERFQAICDLASARLANIGGATPQEHFDNLQHDLKEIVRLTGKTWR